MAAIGDLAEMLNRFALLGLSLFTTIFTLGQVTITKLDKQESHSKSDKLLYKIAHLLTVLSVPLAVLATYLTYESSNGNIELLTNQFTLMSIALVFFSSASTSIFNINKR